MTLSLSDAYQEHVLNDPSVCSNCFGLQRETALDVVPTSQFNKAALEGKSIITRTGKRPDLVVTTHQPSRDEQTSHDFAPARVPSQSKRVFCDCGVHGSYDRIWTFPEAERDIELGFAWLFDEQTERPLVHTFALEQFTAHLKRLIRTVESKGVSVAREEFITTALAARESGAHPDEAFSRGLEAGIQHAEIRSRTGSSPRVTAD